MLMSLIVFAVSGAPRPWCVLAGLTLKQLDFEVRTLQASKREHKSPAFLKLNPRGTVPVLQAGDLTLRDSIGILAWLDRQYPERPLFGETPHDAGHIWQAVLESAQYLRAAHNDLFAPIFLQGRPVPKKDTEEARAMLAAADRLRAECARLESMFESGAFHSAFLCGDTPTAADAVAFPDIRLLQRGLDTKPDHMTAAGLDTLWTELPKLRAWKDRFESLPGMARTMPPHWQAAA